MRSINVQSKMKRFCQGPGGVPKASQRPWDEIGGIFAANGAFPTHFVPNLMFFGRPGQSLWAPKRPCGLPQGLEACQRGLEACQRGLVACHKATRPAKEALWPATRP